MRPVREPPTVLQPTPDVVKSLQRAGLGTRYMARSLTEFGDAGAGQRLWLRDQAGKTEITTGLGRSVYGDTANTHDFFMVLARACHIGGIRVKIVSLSTLIREVSGHDIDDEIISAPALFLHPFYDPTYKELPMTMFQRLACEDVLVERLDNGKAVFTLSRDRLAKANAWWSDALIGRIVASNLEIGVK